MTVATVVLRRGEEYLSVTVEGRVRLTDTDVEIDALTYREAFDEFAGVFPATLREVESMERALEEEAVEEARDLIEERRESFWDARPYVLEEAA